MAWEHVMKAYDSVVHNWFTEVLRIRRVQVVMWTISHLPASWNTKIVAVAKQGPKIFS